MSEVERNSDRGNAPGNDHDDDRVNDRALERAIAALREEVPVRTEWRDALDRELASTPAPMREPIHEVAREFKGGFSRGWNVSPIMAIAAALVCMVAGAVANNALRRDPAIRDMQTATPISAASSPIGVRFSVMAPGVRRVSLVGDFNGWDADATPLELSRDGQTWSTMFPLAAGRHAYAFVIDGQVVRDPTAPAAPDEDFGVPNSLVLVSSSQSSSQSNNQSHNQ